MNYLGEAGYRRITERVLATRRAIEAGVHALGLRTLGRPELSIVAYGSPDHDIAAIGQGLLKRGWLTGYVTNPSGIHLMLNLTHEPVVDRYLADLGEAMKEAGPVGSGKAVSAVY